MNTLPKNWYIEVTAENQKELSRWRSDQSPYFGDHYLKVGHTLLSKHLSDGSYYYLGNAEKVREHASAIVKDGYRHNDGEVFEHYPPHRILKVKSENIPTNYPDTVEGT